MLHFFRKIRHDLIANSKTYKYLKYAIGEIVLVVIGILIALQINNWNEQNKRNKEEQIILNDLKYEIITNIKQLEEVTGYHEMILNEAYKLRRYIDNPEKISEISSDSLLDLTFQLPGLVFHAENGMLNSILSSGQLNIIRNKKLKQLVSSLKDYKLEKTELSNLIYNYAWEVLAKDIYPKARELSLVGVNYSYDTNVEKYINWKNMFLVTEFQTSFIGMFTNNRRLSIEDERELKVRYEEVVSLINLELNKEN